MSDNHNWVRNCKSSESDGDLVVGWETLPLPAVDSPEGLRYAADVMQSQGLCWIAAAGGSMTPSDHISFTADELRVTAEQTERVQEEKAKREKVIEQVAEAIYESDCYPKIPNWAAGVGGSVNASYLVRARALLDRFDITPKADS